MKPAPDGRLRGTFPHLLRSSAPPLLSVRSWHTVIRVPHEPVAPALQLAIQLIQHEIRQQGRERTALRTAFAAFFEEPAIEHSGRQVGPDNPEYPPVGDPGVGSGYV